MCNLLSGMVVVCIPHLMHILYELFAVCTYVCNTSCAWLIYILCILLLQTYFLGCGESSHSVSAAASQLKHGITLKEMQPNLSKRGDLKEAVGMWVEVCYSVLSVDGLHYWRMKLF